MLSLPNNTMNRYLRASSLSAYADCGAYESKPFDTKITKSGTERHAALETWLRDNDQTLLKTLPSEDREGVEWAYDYIKLNTSAEHLIEYEQSASVEIDGVKVSGRFDVVSHDQGFDLKWRILTDKSYEPQIAFYSLMAMAKNKVDHFTYHLLYGQPKIAKIIKFTPQSAEAIVRKSVANAKKGEAKACGWCSWCKHAASCPALGQAVVKVSKGWLKEIESFDANQLTDPKMLSTALVIARALKPWQESIEAKAKEAALAGQALEGFKLTERNLPRKITDLNRAFNIIAKETGMNAEEFMRCCNLQQGNLVDAVAEAMAIPKTKARELVKGLLAEVYQPLQKTKGLTRKAAS